MKKVSVFFADGFEEIEAIATIDLLRRAGCDVNMVSVKDTYEVLGMQNIKIVCEKLFNEDDALSSDCLILPGGAGFMNLQAHEGLKSVLNKACKDNNKIVAAICAAPTILGAFGLLEGKKAVCYPGMESGLLGAEVTNEKCCVDGNIVTSKGIGTVFNFSLKLIEMLEGSEAAEMVRKASIDL